MSKRIESVLEQGHQKQQVERMAAIIQELESIDDEERALRSSEIADLCDTTTSTALQDMRTLDMRLECVEFSEGISGGPAIRSESKLVYRKGQ